MVALALFVVAASGAVATLLFALGAWPVIGFTGLEVLLVLGLLWRHRRGGRRAMEVLVLAGDRLVVRRTDARGRREEVALDAYWTRVSLEERPGTAGRLLLTERRRARRRGREPARRRGAAGAGRHPGRGAAPLPRAGLRQPAAAGLNGRRTVRCAYSAGVRLLIRSKTRLRTAGSVMR